MYAAVVTIHCELMLGVETIPTICKILSSFVLENIFFGIQIYDLKRSCVCLCNYVYLAR